MRGKYNKISYIQCFGLTITFKKIEFMRLYLKLTKSAETIPFNYQHLLTGATHKWIGEENKEHGDVSLYSFSWLQKVNTNNKGIILTRDSYFFISTFKDDLLKAILKGVLENPFVCCGS